MQKQYQIDKQRAVRNFQKFASEVNPTIQTILPLSEIVGLLQEGVGHLMREAGLLLMMGIMEEEVRHVVGERSVPNRERQASRWGKEQGYCVIDGQKVPMPRTRVRGQDGRERKLGSYELFQRRGRLQAVVWDKMMRGLSTRNYGPVVKEFTDAYGIEKSAVSAEKAPQIAGSVG